MRILLMTWACDLEDVSEPAVSARWVAELAKDHDITLFSVSRPERYGCVRRQFPGLEVYEWCDIRVPKALERFRAIVKPGYVPYYFRARRFLKRLLLEKTFDVIHHLSPFSWRYPSPAAGLGVPLLRGPVAGGLATPSAFKTEAGAGAHPFMFLRGADGFRLRNDPLLRSAFEKADHVLMAATYVRTLLAPLSIKSSGIEIEHGVTIDSLPPPMVRRGQPDGSVKLLFVGRIVATKGLRYAIRAIAQAASRSSVTLTVIGDGDDLPVCRNEAERLGVCDSIRFLGWRSKDEVAEQYAQADVFLFPSYREPTGGVLLEAMMNSLPVITCAYGGPDYIVDDSCGIKVLPTSEEAYASGLAAAIDRLVLDPALRQSMSVKARARIAECFGWEEKRKRISELYARLAAAGARQSAPASQQA